MASQIWELGLKCRLAIAGFSQQFTTRFGEGVCVVIRRELVRIITKKSLFPSKEILGRSVIRALFDIGLRLEF